MAWNPLVESNGDIAITPPNFYAVVASVKSTHSKDNILKIAAKHNLNVFQYEEWPDDGGGYRQIAAQGQAIGSASLPWHVPFPLSVADSSHIIQAWASAPEMSPTKPPPPPVSQALPTRIIGAIVIVGFVGAAAMWWFLREN